MESNVERIVPESNEFLRFLRVVRTIQNFAGLPVTLISFKLTDTPPDPPGPPGPAGTAPLGPYYYKIHWADGRRFAQTITFASRTDTNPTITSLSGLPGFTFNDLLERIVPISGAILDLHTHGVDRVVVTAL